MIKSIEEDIIVVSVVGKARTGKSYLMNLLLENIGKEKSFEVQSSIASCTKGIWVWGNYRKKKNGNARIIFIDSEGTSSVDRLPVVFLPVPSTKNILPSPHPKVNNFF